MARVVDRQGVDTVEAGTAGVDRREDTGDRAAGDTAACRTAVWGAECA